MHFALRLLFWVQDIIVGLLLSTPVGSRHHSASGRQYQLSWKHTIKAALILQ